MFLFTTPANSDLKHRPSWKFWPRRCRTCGQPWTCDTARAAADLARNARVEYAIEALIRTHRDSPGGHDYMHRHVVERIAQASGWRRN